MDFVWWIFGLVDSFGGFVLCTFGLSMLSVWFIGWMVIGGGCWVFVFVGFVFRLCCLSCWVDVFRAMFLVGCIFGGVVGGCCWLILFWGI